MSDKSVGVAVLFGAVMLSGCMAPLVPPEDRAAVCSYMPPGITCDSWAVCNHYIVTLSRICRTGRAWPWDRWRVNIPRIKEDVAAKQAAAERAEQEKAARAEEIQRQVVAQQAQATEARRQKTSAPRYINRRTEKFSSFEDAFTALKPESDSRALLLRDPMALKERPVDTLAQVVQVVDGDRLLLNPCNTMEQTCLVLGTVSPFYSGRREFVDDQVIELVGEVVGTVQYRTALGVEKTVPEFYVYGIRPYGAP